MRVDEAKWIARQWVAKWRTTESATDAGFLGAFFHGSVNGWAADALVPVGSDVDVMLVFATAPPVKPGKFIYRDLLLEVSTLPWDALGSPEHLLGRYNLAGSFSVPSIIADPTGELTRLNRVVIEQFAQRRWVVRRLADAQANVLRHLQRLDTCAPLHDQVTSWLFGTGVMTHVLLVAGLRNPTVRTRYRAVKDLLDTYGMPALYATLLEFVGCRQLSPTHVQRHLTALGPLFDTAAAAMRSPFPFGADITPGARSIAIEGSRALIQQHEHQEAVFWIVATYSRCLKVLEVDAPDQLPRFANAYRALLADLGIDKAADLHARSRRVVVYLPTLMEAAEAIVAANPHIPVEPTSTQP